jgi:hypothetical protein
MRKSGAVLLASILLGGCGGANVSKSWTAVDACLKQHPSFVGNVGGDETGGPGNRGTLSVEGSAGALANAWRYASHAVAVADTAGMGPPGPTVTYYGNIALAVNASTSQNAAASIVSCFDQVYGTSASSGGAGTSTTQAAPAAPDTTPTTASNTAPTTTPASNASGVAPVVQMGPVPRRKQCDASVLTDVERPNCPLAERAFAAVVAAYQNNRQVPARVTVADPASGGTATLSCDIQGDAVGQSQDEINCVNDLT